MNIPIEKALHKGLDGIEAEPYLKSLNYERIVERRTRHMKKSILITLILICIVSLSIAVTAFAAKNNVIYHPFSSDHYNENPAPVYTENNTKDVKDFVSEDKCIESIAQTKTSHIISKELKTWGQHVKDDKEETTNYQIDPDRMVRVIKTEFPDGLNTKAGFYKNAILTSVFDAETGNLIESHITGEKGIK